MKGFISKFSLAASFGLASCAMHGNDAPQSLYDSVDWNDPELHPDRVEWDEAQAMHYQDVVARIMPETDLLFIGAGNFENHNPYHVPFSDEAIESYTNAGVTNLFLGWPQMMTQVEFDKKIEDLRDEYYEDGHPKVESAVLKAHDAGMEIVPVSPLSEGMMFYNAIDQLMGRGQIFNPTLYDGRLAKNITKAMRDTLGLTLRISNFFDKEEAPPREKFLGFFGLKHGTRKQDDIPERMIKRDLRFARIDLYPDQGAFLEKLKAEMEYATKINEWDRRNGRTPGEDFPDFIYLTREGLLIPTDETQPRLLVALGFNDENPSLEAQPAPEVQ